MGDNIINEIISEGLQERIRINNLKMICLFEDKVRYCIDRGMSSQQITDYLQKELVEMNMHLGQPRII